ncbi:MAG: ABC transporter ATP-binding protein [Clostridia bacterium]|nr:ABC transporter ATP-binding protein [Clostridia bacterium]
MSLLEIKNLTNNYGKFIALDDVSLSAESGKIIGLLGPNGSGKTTLLKCVAGLLTVEKGEITVDGSPVGEDTKKIVSFLPERTYLDNNATVEESMKFFVKFYEDFDEDKARELLRILNVNPMSKLKTLSKGTKEKVQLVLVMSRHAKLFLLDEPIAGVDPSAREFILQTIIKKHEEGATIIISTHLIRDIEEILDDYVFISYNKIVASGSATAVHAEGKTVDETFREMFRCQ